MSRFIHPLDHVRVAAPCAADWERMRGNDCVRFCDRCNLNVYNLSAMSLRDSEQLIMRTEDRLCVRFYRRTDGTILTQNCPVGLHALKRRVSKIAGAVFAAVTTFLVGSGLAVKTAEVTSQPLPVPVAEEATMAMGAYSFDEPVREPYGAGIFLGGALFLAGYPLMRLRARKEARRRAELHIWRRS